MTPEQKRLQAMTPAQRKHHEIKAIELKQAINRTRAAQILRNMKTAKK